MAVKFDKEAIIKHRFWIMLGVAVPMVLFALYVLRVDIASANAAKQKNTEKALKEIQTYTSRFPSKEEISKILAQAKGRWRPFFITAVFTGMRSSELRGLTWDAVSFEEKKIHVHQRADAWNEMGEPKSEAGDRKIPMTPMVVNALREWKLACPKGKLGLVFPNGNGNIENHGNITNRGFYALQLKTNIVDTTGGPKYGFHSLRHFFASWAIEQGFTPKRLQALLGHSSIQMTFDTYGGLFPDDEDDQARFAAGELAVTRVATQKG